MSELR